MIVQAHKCETASVFQPCSFCFDQQPRPTERFRRVGTDSPSGVVLVRCDLLHKIEVFFLMFSAFTTHRQDGTQWKETTLTGNEKIEDTVQCVSTSGRPGHATIQVYIMGGEEFAFASLSQSHTICQPIRRETPVCGSDLAEVYRERASLILSLAYLFSRAKV